MFADAEYYDGQTPIPRKGRLQLSPRDVLFVGEDGHRAAFAYDRIVEISSAGGRHTLELNDDSGNSSSASLVFSDANFLADLQRNLRGSANVSLATRSRGITTAQKVVGALALLPLVAGVYYFFMYESYRFVPVAVDRHLGDRVEGRFVGALDECTDPALDAFMQRLQQRMTPADAPFEYRVSVVDDDTINAFALPGGRIVFFHGLIRFAESPEEVAAVLAHEMAHVDERHGVRSMIRSLGLAYISATVIGAGFEGMELAELISEVATLGLLLKYSRQFEEEADLAGVETLEAAGISPLGFAAFFERLANTDLMPSLGDLLNDEEATDLDPEAPGEATDNEDVADDEEADDGEDADGLNLSWLSTHPAPEERVRYFRERGEKIKTSDPSLLLPGENWLRLKSGCR